tara:strand:- start:42 stop:548 length:507 start_codon:yes stop_codon:yes gene_type:complete
MEHSMSTLKTNTIQAATGTTVNVASGQVLNAPGHVIQVIQGVFKTQEVTTSDSFQTSAIAQAITPSSASSKILITISFVTQVQNTTRGRYTILSSATGAALTPSGETSITAIEAANINQPITIQHLDSPNTTSAVTYSLQYRNDTNGNNCFIMPSDTPGYITLEEIAQ